MSTALTEKNGAAKVQVSVGTRGVQFSSLDELGRFAVWVSKTAMAPKGMESPEAIGIAIQLGMELGLPPMAALQNIAVINGRPSVWGDAMLAICRGSGIFDESVFEETVAGEKDNQVATCVVRRLPNGKPVSRTFSMTDAKRAGLSGKSGPWTQYPARMLQMRARSFALRDAFSDILKGIYSAEEVRDIVPAAPIEVTATVHKPASLDELSEQVETREIIKDDGEIVMPGREEFALSEQ